MDWKRLTYRPDGLKISFSTHLFLYITFVFGLAFVLPPELTASSVSPLWTFSSDFGAGLYWGYGLILVTVMNTIMLLTQSRRLASVTGVLGFCLWLYAALVYVYVGYWLGLVSMAIPCMLFWAWYSVTVTQFKNSMPPRS